MEDFADNRVETIVVRCTTQSGKTQTLMCLLCWSVVEDPGPALWVSNSQDDLKVFIRDRIQPTFEQCPSVRSLIVKAEVFGYDLVSMPLYFAGAGSRGKLKSKPWAANTIGGSFGLLGSTAILASSPTVAAIRLPSLRRFAPATTSSRKTP